MKKHLLERTWKAFPVSDVFSIIQRGKRLKNSDHVPGRIPYASSSGAWNGIDDFISNAAGVRTFEWCLTLANSGSVGSVFFHPYRFVASDHVTALARPALSRHAYLFLAVALGKLAKNYSFNREINDNRLAREKILLPATPGGAPDFAFMDAFMREKERTILERYAACARQAAEEPLPPCGAWKAFALTDVFSISPGVRLTKAEMVPGNTPFAGASDSNNGITAFVGNRNASLDANVLGVNYNGSVVENFYHPYETLFSDDVKRFRLKNHPGNRHVYLFLKVALLQQKRKYEYGYKFNEAHMRRQKLMLPATAEGTPDYAYMEASMRRKEAEMRGRYARMRLEKMKGRTFQYGFATGWDGGAQAVAEPD